LSWARWDCVGFSNVVFAFLPWNLILRIIYLVLYVYCAWIEISRQWATLPFSISLPRV
jgi:hypothetical protein